MTMEYWILGPDHELIPVDLLTWARWFEDFSHRAVKQEEIGPYQVSTVFLGFDHGFSRFLPGHEDDPPILFETMAFRPTTEQERSEAIENAERWNLPKFPHLREEIAMDRCATWDEAITQHERIAARIRALAAG